MKNFAAISLLVLLANTNVTNAATCSSKPLIQFGGCQTEIDGKKHKFSNKEITEEGCRQFCEPSLKRTGHSCASIQLPNIYLGCEVEFNGKKKKYDKETIVAESCITYCDTLRGIGPPDRLPRLAH